MSNFLATSLYISSYPQVQTFRKKRVLGGYNAMSDVSPTAASICAKTASIILGQEIHTDSLTLGGTS